MPSQALPRHAELSHRAPNSPAPGAPALARVPPACSWCHQLIPEHNPLAQGTLLQSASTVWSPLGLVHRRARLNEGARWDFFDCSLCHGDSGSSFWPWHPVDFLSAHWKMGSWLQKPPYYWYTIPGNSQEEQTLLHAKKLLSGCCAGQLCSLIFSKYYETPFAWQKYGIHSREGELLE